MSLGTSDTLVYLIAIPLFSSAFLLLGQVTHGLLLLARVSAKFANELGVKNGDLVTVSTDRGSLALPIEVSELLDGVIWLPRNGVGAESLRILGALNGDGVKVRKGI